MGKVEQRSQAARVEAARARKAFGAARSAHVSAQTTAEVQRRKMIAAVQAMAAAGMTQRAICAETGLSRQTVHSYVNG